MKEGATRATKKTRLPCGRIVTAAVAAIVTLGPLVSVCGEDWPTYRHDAARSGRTSESLQLPLTQRWVYEPLHPPAPAWAPPQPKPIEGILELPRMRFDDAFHVAIAGDAPSGLFKGLAFFGSSADHTVRALDLTTGHERWSLTTGGPVRLAPTVWKSKVYFGSDDGCAYCVEAASGRVVWKLRAAPADDRLLGSGRMISRWPIRTGVLIRDGIAYFAAGIFPGEGLYLYAVRAEDGAVVWKNDAFGQGGRREISPQGYALASADKLFLPSGRSVPAAFDIRDGRFLFQRTVNRFREGTYGGTDAVLADDHVFSGTEQILSFATDTGKAGYSWFDGQLLVVDEDTFYIAKEKEIVALDRKAYPAASRELQSLKHRRQDLKKVTDAEKRKKATQELVADEKANAGKLAKATRWRLACECRDALILAGDTLFAGGQGRVVAIDAKSGKRAWQVDVDGKARGLAVAAGRLLVSTDTGAIHCFVPGDVVTSTRVRPTTTDAPYPSDDRTRYYVDAATTILDESGVRRGYALILGGGTGRLALEIARRSDLHVIVVEPHADTAERAREAALAAGLYGTRICVDHGPLDALPYSDYFANLIVYEAELRSNDIATPPAELLRLLKPMGGFAYVGLPVDRGRPTTDGEHDRMLKWMDALPDDGSLQQRMREKTGTKVWASIKRRGLDGAGHWTHQYADSGNTTCSDDRLIKAPLGLLWYGEPGPTRMVNRHASAAAPLAVHNRLFVQGEHVIMAYDIYNGLHLWDREIPGVARTGLKLECGNLAATGDRLYVAVGARCLELDQATGKTVRTFRLPPTKDRMARRWGYVATRDGLLFGSRTAKGRTADAVFAIDLDDGERRWIHEGREIMHACLAVGDGRIHLVDQSETEAQRQQALKARKTPPPIDRKGQPAIDARVVVTLDAASGDKLWEQVLDVTDSVKVSKGGGELSAIYRDGVLLLFSAPWNGHFWQEFHSGEFSRRSLIALGAKDGAPLWSGKIGYRSRPIVVGDTIFAEPWARNLHTGEQVSRDDPITGAASPWQMARPGHHCGCMAASAECLFFRSESIAYYDLESDEGTTHFGAIRPGCWINFVPAGGVLLVPEGSSGCVCAFPIHCTVAFKHRETERRWGMYSSADGVTPVQRLGINFGAPGDRKDDSGTMWLAYPRPRSDRLVVDLQLETTAFASGRYYENDPATTSIAGAKLPWIVASGYEGLRRCAIPLVGDDEPAGTYTVRLHFAEPDRDAKPGQRVFDVALQGHRVLDDFDILTAAGGENRAVVREFTGVEVTRDLTIDLESAPGSPRATLLCGVEVVRTRVDPVSLRLPSFQISDFAARQAGKVIATNQANAAFRGVLRAVAPKGFRVEPAHQDLRIAAGGRATVEFAVTLDGTPAPGDYAIDIGIAGPSGNVEIARKIPIRYTGASGEVTVQAAADAHVKKGQADDNLGAAVAMWNDGGDKEMADAAHCIVYCRFPIDVPGVAIRARFRTTVNSGQHSQSGNAGHLHVVEGAWDEKTITYANRPPTGKRIGTVGKVALGERIERALDIDLSGRKEITIAIVPASLDGAGFVSREGGKPAELVIEYRPK